MKVSAVINFEIDPTIAAKILADPFPVSEMEKYLNGNDVEYTLADVEPQYSHILTEVRKELGIHLAQQMVTQVKQLAASSNIVESVAASINGD